MYASVLKDFFIRKWYENFFSEFLSESRSCQTCSEKDFSRVKILFVLIYCSKCMKLIILSFFLFENTLVVRFFLIRNQKCFDMTILLLFKNCLHVCIFYFRYSFSLLRFLRKRHKSVSLNFNSVFTGLLHLFSISSLSTVQLCLCTAVRYT